MKSVSKFVFTKDGAILVTREDCMPKGQLAFQMLEREREARVRIAQDARSRERRVRAEMEGWAGKAREAEDMVASIDEVLEMRAGIQRPEPPPEHPAFEAVVTSHNGAKPQTDW